MKLNVPNPFSEVQESIRLVRGEIKKVGKDAYVVSKTDKGFIEVGVSIGEGIFYGREKIGSSVIESTDLAELKALLAICDHLGIQTSYEPRVKPTPDSKFSEWNAVRVRSYKFIEDLLKDMEKDKFDMTDIYAYRQELINEKKRLTPDKVAEKFFRKAHKTVIQNKPEVNIEPVRNNDMNPSWSAVFKKMTDNGWTDEKIKESFGKTFSGLVDFCKFAPSSTIDQCR